jgi:phosphocarrier protein
MPFIRTLTICNVKGLHARASARFVETVESFDANATVRRDGQSVAGDSIMGLLMLAASQGTTIDVSTAGPQAQDLMTALETLVADRFGEEK